MALLCHATRWHESMLMREETEISPHCRGGRRDWWPLCLPDSLKNTAQGFSRPIIYHPTGLNVGEQTGTCGYLWCKPYSSKLKLSNSSCQYYFDQRASSFRPRIMSLKWTSLSKLQKKAETAPLLESLQNELFSASEILLSSIQVSTNNLKTWLLQLQS